MLGRVVGKIFAPDDRFRSFNPHESNNLYKHGGDGLMVLFTSNMQNQYTIDTTVDFDPIIDNKL